MARAKKRAVGRVIPANPAEQVELAAVGRKEEHRRVLTAEEQQWIWDTPHQAQPVAVIMMLSGLRRGEPAALTWADVDLERQKSGKPGPKRLDRTIPNITLHWLRHTFCALLYLAGVDVVQAYAQIGHADVSTTLRIYTHLDATHKRKSVDKLDAYLSGRREKKRHASQMHVKNPIAIGIRHLVRAF